MATRFARTSGRVTVRLELGEMRLLDALFADVALLLTDDTAQPDDPLAAQLGLSDLGIGHHVRRPDDPALARLLPDASRDDPEAAADFRRFTERGLRRRKADGLAAVRESLHLPDREPGPDGDDDPAEATWLSLDDHQAHAWVVALTDLRLVLADRLGVRTDADAEALHARVDDPEDTGPDAWLAMVYDFVSWLQESLTDVLLSDLPEAGDRRRLPPPPR